MAWIIENPLISALLLGFVLDSILGDPLWIPHPIRLFGKMISSSEKWFNKGSNRKLKGVIVATTLISFTWLMVFLLFHYVENYVVTYIILSSVGVFYGLANHGLIKEAYKVESALKQQGLEKARLQLSMIVGRDTTNLNAQQIRIAVLETLAENLSDGVIAPLFFYALGGVPLMLAYKMVQTLDSMIGYKSDRYKQFGWFAARFDDVLNYLPARITALLMVFVSFSWCGVIFIFRYGRKHASPNAGIPEAALAGILNVQFGGPNIYHGKLVDKPFIGNNPRPIIHQDLIKACLINATVALVMVLVLCVIFIKLGTEI